MARTTSAARICPLSQGAESGRLDHRIPEVVIVLPGDLAAAQPDPQADRFLAATVVPFDALLHGHRAGQGGRGRGEDHHEPVAQVLDLGAAGLGDGLAEDREVAPADLVGRVWGRRGTARSSPPRR